ncbi:MAG: hypothetical protein PUP92_17050 [Rhizonema sp. PD38]|nr:hypothetical protein [Rhizonema sp. PD38]
MTSKKVKTQYIRDLYDVRDMVGLANDAINDYSWMREESRDLLCGCIVFATVIKNSLDRYFEQRGE